MSKKSEEKREKLHNETGESPFLLLSDTQWRYITAMIENPTFSKKEAADYIGISEKTAYGWTQKAPHVDEALEISRKDVHSATLARRKQLTLKALAVKASGLDSEDENIRQKTATEILEWELGKATQHTETKTDGEVKVKLILSDGKDVPDYS